MTDTILVLGGVAAQVWRGIAKAALLEREPGLDAAALVEAADDTACCGMLFASGVFSIPPPTPAPVPQAISPLQARRALRAAGLIDAVKTAVAAADADTQDAWEYATIIHRDNPILLGMAQQLGLTGEQLDQLFIAAAAL